MSRALNAISNEIRDISYETGLDLTEARSGVQKGSFLCTDAVLADEAKEKKAC